MERQVSYKINLPDGYYTVHKITPVEPEGCQDLDDIGKIVNISNTQRYKAIGNG